MPKKARKQISKTTPNKLQKKTKKQIVKTTAATSQKKKRTVEEKIAEGKELMR